MAADRLVETMALCGLAGESWWPWTVVAQVLDGAPLDARELELFRACTGRDRPPSAPPRELWCICGRRSGKSRFAGACAVHAASKRYALAPGEQAVVAIAAADREQARVALQFATAPFRDEPELRPLVRQRSAWQSLRALVQRETRWGIDLRTGVSVEVRTSHFGKIRGRTFAMAVADEASFWASDDGSNPATEVLAAIRPGLVTLRGPLLVVTSPFAKSGPVWDAYARYFGRDDARVLIWNAPSRTMNATIDEAEVADALDRDPEAAKAEWLGLFRDDAAALVTDAALRAVVVAGRGKLARVPDVDYLGFCDTATGSGTDSHAFAVAHVEQEPDGKLIAVVDVAREWRPPFDPAEAVAACVALCREYGVAVVYADRVGWGWIDAAFTREGVRYEPSPLTASALYVAGVSLINTRQVELPDDARLVAQLAGLSRRVGQGGRDYVEHGRRGDDLANATMGSAVLVHRLASEESARPPARIW